jgi:DNA-directed DNA polymerase III PolC
MYLNCHTHFSLRFGIFSERELLDLAAQHQVHRLALTDINNTSACLNYIRLCQKRQLQAVVGIDFRNGNKQCYVGLAKNNQGFSELNQYLSSCNAKQQAFSVKAPHTAHCFFIYPFQHMQIEQLNTLRTNEYIGVSLNDLKRLRFSPLIKFPEKLVLLHPVTFRNKNDFNTHRLLRAIDQNVLLSKLPKTEEAEEWEVMHNIQEVEKSVVEFPFLLANAEAVWNQCNINFDFSVNRRPQNLATYTGSSEQDLEMMRRLCKEGMAYRYGSVIPQRIIDRLHKELQLIEKMNFVSYFLINWDIVHYARSQDYFYVGRGSGANSIVAYLLRITDVDPIELDLYFERFINLYRLNPPDFDIDFSWRDREAVTRYIFERFDHVALLATYNTFQFKAAVREIGKVLGFPKHEIDILSSGKFNMHELDRMSRLVLTYSERIQGIPNHLSIHAGGILIANQPIHCYTATNVPPKGFPTTQFDMHIAEDVGLYKFDILGQRGLAKIKEALSIVRNNRKEACHIDIHQVKQFINDPNINALVKRADCLGCFYVESPAMRMLLKKLEVNNYLGLVAASSIIRPGVANSGMMREYILRHQNPDRIKDAHPVLLEIMPETYGVMVYQEDVIKVAHYFADLTLGEADVLRRGMSGKFRSREEFKKVQQRYFSNCRKKGHPDALVAEVWRQIESFAGYAFAKGHSASYAVESYQSLFLRTYYPLEFMVAVLNNGGGFYSPEVYIHEIRMLGGTVHAPCVNHSKSTTTIDGKAIFLGLHFIKGLEKETIDHLVEERLMQGPFQHLEDVQQRLSISIEQLTLLIRANAFRFTEKNKRTLLWEAYFQSGGNVVVSKQQQLFKVAFKKYELPALSSSPLEEAFDQIELFGFPLISPFSLLKEALTMGRMAADLPNCLGQVVTLYGYLVSVKNTTTKQGAHMNFGTFLDVEGRFVDTTHFPAVAVRYPFRGGGVYRIQGKVVEEFGFYSLEVATMEKCAYISDPRYTFEKASA